MPRSVAGGRTAATNRVAVQDIKSSLNFATPGTNKLVTPLACSVLNNGYTLACYVSPNVLGKKHHIFKNGTVNDKMWFNVESNGVIRMYNQELSFPALVTAANTAQVGKYLHAVATFNATTGKRVIYVNGTSVATDTRTGTLTLGAELLVIGGSSDVTNDANAKFSNAQVWNRALTADEVSSLYKSGIVPTSGLLLNYKLDEGAGTTAYDTSGNGNNGTITAGTYTADVPTKKRELVGGNLVKNCDFEYAPPFVAATTTTARWIDGTAMGSTTNSLFGWSFRTVSGSCAAQFDSINKRSGNYSLKLSTTATGSRVFVYFNSINGNIDKTLYNIPSKPNTSYTLSYWMKTSLISGSSTGARIGVQKKSVAGVTGEEFTNSIGIATTTGWTYYSFTFTTNAALDTPYLLVTLQIVGQDGAGTLIMDAWFDDITLTPTVNTTRTAV